MPLLLSPTESGSPHSCSLQHVAGAILGLPHACINREQQQQWCAGPSFYHLRPTHGGHQQERSGQGAGAGRNHLCAAVAVPDPTVPQPMGRAGSFCHCHTPFVLDIKPHLSLPKSSSCLFFPSRVLFWFYRL